MLNRLPIARIHRDAPAITPLVTEALRTERNARSLCRPLQQLATDQTAALAIRIDALTALLAIGEPIAPILQAEPDLVEPFLAGCDRNHTFLSNAIHAAINPTLSALGDLAQTIETSVWEETLSSILAVNLTYGGVPVHLTGLFDRAPESLQPLVMAETWQYYFARNDEDPLYNMVVALDTVGGRCADTPWTLARAFAAASSAINGQWVGHPGWIRDIAVHHPRTDLQLLAAALDAIMSIPTPFQFVRGWALARLAPALKDFGLHSEGAVLALCLVPDQFDARYDAFVALSERPILTMEHIRFVLRNFESSLTRKEHGQVYIGQRLMRCLYSNAPTLLQVRRHFQPPLKNEGLDHSDRWRIVLNKLQQLSKAFDE